MAMPELPEVETTVRGLAPVLVGARLDRVILHREGLRRPFAPDMGQRLTGARVTAISRRAKYGIIDTDRGDSIVFHLGMTGRWRIDADALEPHDHVEWVTQAGRRLMLNDARRFGSLDLMATAAVPAFAPFSAMGPEPLGPGLTAAGLAAMLAGRRTAVKGLLLDQRIVAGLGNIYVCEALNVARIAPVRAGGDVSRAAIARLVPAIRQVLLASIAAGGSTLRDFAAPDGQLGYFATQFRVYGREGRPCPCGRGVVERIVQGGRSTFFCGRCQR